jgi:hypothetical protein
MLDITINNYMHIKNVKQCVKNTILRLRSHITLVEINNTWIGLNLI